MAVQDKLQKARRKPSQDRAPQLAAVVCIAAILLICLYSAFAIHRMLAANGPPPPPTFTLGTAYRDVTYCNSQTLDVYVPRSAATRPLPLAIFVHGGGLTAGSKAYLNPTFLNALARAGFDVGPYAATSSAIVAAVDMFGPADLPSWISPQGLNEAFGGNRTNLVLASPAHYVRANAPPILIVQGVADTTVPEAQSAELYRKLNAAGDQTRLVLVDHMGHMFAQVGSRPIDPGLTQLAADMVRWFQRYGAES